MIPTKRCPKCGEHMAADLFNFAPRDKHGKLDGWCRTCRSIDQMARYHRKRADAVYYQKEARSPDCRAVEPPRLDRQDVARI